jgi:hypothetical protein
MCFVEARVRAKFDHLSHQLSHISSGGFLVLTFARDS